MRERLYDIVNQNYEGDKLARLYNRAMFVFILASLVPLLFKEEFLPLVIIDKVCVVVFIIDYLLRLITADYKFKKHAATSFVKYPFTPMAIVDLISILPSLTILNNGFKLLRLLRISRTFRVFRVFKTFRYSKNFRIIVNVLKRSKQSLIAVCSLAAAYILISALVVFNVEPDTFKNFFEAIYWATVSLTTVGYGDIYPVSVAGRIVTMVSSIIGIAIIALPAGIITAGYMSELNDIKNDSSEDTRL